MKKQKAIKIKDEVVEQYHAIFASSDNTYCRRITIPFDNSPAIVRRVIKIFRSMNNVYNDAIGAVFDDRKQFAELIKDKSEDEVALIKKSFKPVEFNGYSRAYTVRKDEEIAKLKETVKAGKPINFYDIPQWVLPSIAVQEQIKRDLCVYTKIIPFSPEHPIFIKEV